MKISVIIPVFNREKYLATAIESILKQSFKAFELIIIDDGSMDSSYSIACQYMDSRIRIIKNPENIGIPKSRNLGLKLAQGEFIFWLDSDDYCEPTILQRELKVIESRKSYAAVGSWFIRNGKIYRKRKLPSNPNVLKSFMFLKNPVLTSGLLMRNSIIQINDLTFDESFSMAEDYLFFINLMKYGDIKILPAFLTYHRHHETNIINHESANHLKVFLDRIACAQMQNIRVNVSESYLKHHAALREKRSLTNSEELNKLGEWIDEIIEANRQMHYFHLPSFEMNLDVFWLAVCYGSLTDYNDAYKIYLDHGTKNKVLLSAKRIKFLIRKTWNNKS